MDKSLREYWNRRVVPAISCKRGDSIPSKWKTLKESSAEVFCDEMESLYWDAATREMMNAVRTLHGWFNEDKETIATFLNRNQGDPDSLEVARKFLEQVTSPGQALRSIYGRLFEVIGAAGNANRLAKKKRVNKIQTHSMKPLRFRRPCMMIIYLLSMRCLVSIFARASVI